MSRVAPVSATSIASSRSRGIPKVRTKSQPVPRGMTASSTPSAAARPFTTSFTEPSPPTTTSRVAPADTASAASAVRRPGASETSASPSSTRAAARRAISGQRFPVEPAAAAGLTRKTVRPVLMAVLARGGGRERDPRHAIDRGSQLVVGDPHELALDDDVADREQAPALDTADRGKREQRSRLHLHREYAALRPALVLALVGVVEEVARDDRADAELLLRVLRYVDCLVHELPARGRAVRLAPDEVDRRRVRRDGRDGDDEVAERVIRLQAPARADAEQSLDAELDELLEHDGRSRAAHPGSLHRDPLALPLARIAEETSLRVDLDGAGQE